MKQVEQHETNFKYAFLMQLNITNLMFVSVEHETKKKQTKNVFLIVMILVMGPKKSTVEIWDYTTEEKSRRRISMHLIMWTELDVWTC